MGGINFGKFFENKFEPVSIGRFQKLIEPGLLVSVGDALTWLIFGNICGSASSELENKH